MSARSCASEVICSSAYSSGTTRLNMRRETSSSERTPLRSRTQMPSTASCSSVGSEAHDMAGRCAARSLRRCSAVLRVRGLPERVT
jgi:hypothetical protein